MDDLIRMLIILILTAVTLPFLFVTLIYLLPNKVQTIRHIIQNRSKRAFIVGFVNTLFFGLLAAVFSNGGDGGGLLALLLLLMLIGVACVGLAATVQLIQQRIYLSESAGDMVKTAVIFTAALLTPIVGWLLFAPILGIIGIGGTLMSLFQRTTKDDKNEAQLPF